LRGIIITWFLINIDSLSLSMNWISTTRGCMGGEMDWPEKRRGTWEEKLEEEKEEWDRDNVKLGKLISPAQNDWYRNGIDFVSCGWRVITNLFDEDRDFTRESDEST
jgi:hypothetical protein